MNDVLPKPFTKEGLLNMLDKHLGHLKKSDTGFKLTNTPQGLTHHGGGHSVKGESSPAASPSTMSNWNSPNQFSGISPSATGPYMQQGTTFGMDQSNMQYTSPTTPIGGPPGGMAHRRQVSEMTGSVEEMGNDPKRPRIYATTNAAMNNMRRGLPG